MRQLRRGGLAGGLVALLLTSCDGGQGEVLRAVNEEDAAQLVAEGLLRDNNPNVGGEAAQGALITAAQAQCFADELVQRPGVRELQSQGVLTPRGEYAGLPQTASQAFATQWTEAFVQCVDLQEYLVAITRTVTTAVDANLPSEPETWEPVLRCVRKTVPEADLLRLYQARLTGQVIDAEPAAPFNQCVGKLKPATPAG